ncbi:MAG: WD40 repeat domain-containing protein [Gemmataceae bacterium]
MIVGALQALVLLVPPALAGSEPAPAADAFGDPLPALALARMGTQRFWHEGHPTAIAFSPDGKILATAAGDIRFWDAFTGKEIARFPNPGDSLKSIDFSADGKTLVGAGTYTPAVYLIDRATGKRRHCIGRPPFGREIIGVNVRNEVRPIALSADGTTVALPFVEDGSEERSHDAKRFRGIRWHDIATGKQVAEFELGETRPRFIALDRAGKSFACLDAEETIVVWNRATGLARWRLRGHAESPLCAAFSGDGSILASGSVDRSVILWDMKTGRLARKLGAHEGPVRSVCFLPDGVTLLSLSSDQVCLWRVTTGEKLREFWSPRNHFVNAAIAPDGDRIAAMDGNVAVVWETASGRLLSPRESHRKAVNAVAFSSDGKRIASGGNDDVMLWDGKGKHIGKLGESGTSAERLAFLPGDKQLVLQAYGETPEVWDMASGKRVRIFSGPKRTFHMRLAPDGKTIATVGEKSTPPLPLLLLWDIDKGEVCREVGVRSEASSKRAIVFHPDGKGIATGESLTIWNPETGMVSLSISDPGDSIAFSPDGKMIATAHIFGEVALYEAATGKRLSKFGERGGWGVGIEWPLFFSPDGRSLALGDKEGVVHLYETATGGERRRFRGHTGHVLGLAFSPDGTKLASASRDTTIVLWDLTAPRPDKEGGSAPWDDLASGDAAQAYDAICSFVMGKDALGRIKASAPSLKKASVEKMEQLIADLQSEEFKVREQATRHLERLQELAFPALENALRRSTSLEATRRLARLVERTEPGKLVPGSERLRWLRILEVLERLRTREAIEIVRDLAEGDSEVRLVQEARTVLRRLR